MMRVLQVITDTDRRGAQVFATDLHDGLATLGCEVTTVALAPGEHGGQLDVEALGPTRTSRSTFAALRRRARAFDVAIAHGSTTLPLCAVSLAGLGTPIVYRQISDPHFWAASLSRRLRTGALLRRAAAVVALSDGVSQVFAEHYRLTQRVLTVIPNAVPGAGFAPATPSEQAAARSHLGITPDSTVAVYIGALAPEKGVDRALDALASCPEALLLIAGDGPERAELEQHAECVAPGRVSFLGSLTDVAPVLAAADALVLPSRGGDSMPAVLIEAGLAGLPCATTDVGAIGDVVLDGKTGYVTPHGDDEATMTSIKALLENPAQRTEFGAAAVENCRAHFTIEATAPRWLQLLESVAR